MSFRNHRVKSTFVAVALALPLALAGCSAGAPPDSPQATSAGSSTTPSPKATATSPFSPTPTTRLDPADFDYAALLLQAADLSDADDTFALRSTKDDPNGLHGASALFVNGDDTRAISVTIANYPDAAVAASTLREAISTADTVVTGGDPTPIAVGTDGTQIRGTAPDGGKAVTLVLFTEGPMLARVEFDSATGDATTDGFVTNVAKMQQIALRVGIPDQAE